MFKHFFDFSNSKGRVALKIRKFELAVIILTVPLVMITVGYMIARVPVAESFDISAERAPAPAVTPKPTPTPAPAPTANQAADVTAAPEEPPSEPPPLDVSGDPSDAPPPESAEPPDIPSGEPVTPKAPTPTLTPTPTPTPAGKVNINTAGLDELQRLTGIGPALAQRILDDREKHGPYESVDELRRVSGIGEKTVEKLTDQATVG